MSAKRAATSNLTHENWDQEDPSDQEELGTYKMASKEVLEKRVFKTAKRRMRTDAGDEPKKTSVFSGFGGFNKTQPSSFDFLANLTNGSKTSNGTSETSDKAKPNLFTNGGSEKPSSLFSIPTSSPNSKITFGAPNDSPKISFGKSNDEAKVTFGIPTDTSKVSFGIPNEAAKISFGTFKDAEKTPFGTPNEAAKTSFGSFKAAEKIPFGTPNEAAKTSFGSFKAAEKIPFGTPNEAAKIPFGTPNEAAKIPFGTPNEAAKISFGTFKDAEKIPFGTPNEAAKISFGIPSSSKESSSTASSVFMTSKSDSPANIISKPTDSETKQTNFSFKPTPTSQSAATLPTSSSLFSVSTASKSQISMPSGSNAVVLQPVSSTNSATSTTATSMSPETLDDTVKDKKMVYYTKLKGLNEAVSKWIQKHVEMTPLCILTPIFNDYQRYLKELQDDYKGKDDNKDKVEEEGSKSDKDTSIFTSKPAEKPGPSIFGIAKQDSNKTTSPFDQKLSDKPISSIFGSSASSKTISPFQASTPNPAAKDAKPSFSFGINPSTPKSLTETASVSSLTSASSPPTGGFSFGIKTTQASATTTPNSSFTLPTTSASPPSAPFSFGIAGQKFNFSPNTKKPETEETKTEEEEDDQPPKVEFTPIVEENSVFDKKCKVFVKKDGNFADIGVGTLYIKTIENSNKHQLLVRANTTMGTILVNLVLASAIPMQRMGKNNVMMICIPTPDSKPPPTSILLRVKTSEEADELLETLNKHKV